MGKGNEIIGKSIGLEFVKRATEQLGCPTVTESQGLDIVEGSAPSEMEEPTSTASVRRAGNVGAPDTVWGGERKKTLENLRMIVIPLDLLAH
jgi:hypothetical protein